MASTYSALKIQLMSTGENSGTWGTVTNTNLGTALEEAVVGSADVTFASSAVTLTLTDSNSSQTARNLRLNLTGTSGGAQNLIVPAIEKIYIVNNGCADAITVKNATGTGIAVPAGKTMYVYNDGTNVVDAVTYLTSLTLGTALPIASGGTGSTSTTYANLQSNVTGTLPIANGGTGSTSTTYANLQSNVSGTLPVANGGSGASSFTANNVLLGNGTSAFQVVAPGSSGNILTSNGTTWQSTAPAGGGVTSLNGQTGAITDTNYGAIGSYAILQNATNSDLSLDGTRAGSGLRYNNSWTSTNFNGNCPSRLGGVNSNVGSSSYNGGGTSLSGTWRKVCNSQVYRLESTPKGTNVYWWAPGLYVRIS